MTRPNDVVRIDPQRLKSKFDTLSRIGATPGGGIHRPALGAADLEARQWFRSRVESSGLRYKIDNAGNQFAILSSGAGEGGAILMGSHLDTVPNGGSFDGALGVVSALECLQTIADQRLNLPVDLCAVNFTDEEGTHSGLLGSRAFTGLLTQAELDHPASGLTTFEKQLTRSGLSRQRLTKTAKSVAPIAAYLELHIEQGPRLAHEGVDIGIVTAIVGIRRMLLTFKGRADHAGTTTIAHRRDAGRAACAFATAAWETVLAEFDDCVINIGDIRITPAFANVVPQQAELDLEMRSGSTEQLDALEARLLARARAAAKSVGAELDSTPLERIAPAKMDPQIQRVIIQQAQRLSLSQRAMPSGAGHDAQSLADLCPTGMIFIPSLGGRSHCPDEHSHWQDCVNGANLLLNTALALARNNGT